MGGDLFELLVALAIIFFGLLGGARRKKGPSSAQDRPGARRVPRVERQAPGEVGRAPSAERPAPGAERAGSATASASSGRDDLFSEIERVLRGRVPEDRPLPPPRAPEPDEAYSLEPLEGEAHEVDAEERHQEFHQKYVTRRATGPLPPATVVPRVVARLRRIPLRQAVMWREILGPPKGSQ